MEWRTALMLRFVPCSARIAEPEMPTVATQTIAWIPVAKSESESAVSVEPSSSRDLGWNAAEVAKS
jgi:hypothetical protein